MFKYLLISLFSLSILAADCSVEFIAEDVEAHFTAFKTPKKIGVKGRFRSLGLTKEEFKGKDLNSILNGLQYKINTKSVWTRNAGRDAKIIKYFFTGFKGGYVIEGKIKSIDDKKLLLSVTMNEVSKDVSMTITKTEKSLKAKGTIDGLDFALGDNLKGINQACKMLHQNKTWSDIDLELKVNFDRECN